MSDWKPANDLLVLLLCFANGQPGVDFQRLSAGVAGIGLDQGIVYALLLQPRQ